MFIKKTLSFKYVVTIVTYNGSTIEDIDTRLSEAKKKLAELRYIMKDNQTRITIKRRILKQIGIKGHST